MSKKTIVLKYPKHLTQEPIAYKLVKEFDLAFNILKAKINPKEEGTLVLQLQGSDENLEKAIDYIQKIGITCDNLSKEIKWLDENCIHCTACISQCPTGSFQVNRKDLYVTFDPESCIVCERCLEACSYEAISLVI